VTILPCGISGKKFGSAIIIHALSTWKRRSRIMSKTGDQGSVRWERVFPDVHKLRSLSGRKGELEEQICKGAGSFERRLQNLKDLISEYDRAIQQYPDSDESGPFSDRVYVIGRERKELEKMLEAMNAPVAKEVFVARKRARQKELAILIGMIALMMVFAAGLTAYAYG
jgi:hypothetical protein